MFELNADGVVRSEAIEINAVHGCNLACRGCSHASPILPIKSFVDPARVHSDLTALSRVYRADHVRLLGGEPLLHPDVLSVVAAVRESGITERVRVVTNGVLLSKMGGDFWDAIDEVYVSTYPGFEPTPDAATAWADAAGRSGTELRLRHYSHFRESYSEEGTTDAGLASRIYGTCLIAHVWRCHNVIDGSFYKCPQSHFLGETGGPEDRDGIVISDDEGFSARLLAYLNDDTPLRSCFRCLGAVGKLYAHEQVRRPEWRAHQERSTEEMVDWQFLELLERSPNSTNDCIDHETVVRG